MRKIRRSTVAMVAAVLLTPIAVVSTTGPSNAASPSARRVSIGQAETVTPEVRDEYRLADVTTPEDLSESDLKHMQELRGAYGLNTDPDYVRSLYADPASAGAMRSTWLLFGNLLVTSDEMPQLEFRSALDLDAQGANAVVRRVLGEERYAASFLWATDYVVLCARCEPDQVKSELTSSADLAPSVRQVISVRRVDYSESELTSLTDRVMQFLADTDSQTNGASVYPMANRVEVHVGANSATGLNDRLASAFRGEPVVVIDDGGDNKPFVNKNDYIIYGIVEGGQAIRLPGSQNTWDCTSGFSVQGAYGPFMTTAGHCGGSTWRQGGADLGTVAAAATSGYMDAEIITTYGYRTTQPRYHNTSTDWFAPVTFVPGNFNDLIGQTVCQAGTTWTGLSGDDHPSTRCGTITTITFDLDGGNSKYAANFISATHKGDYGDSGGSLVWGTVYGWAAVGMVQGGPNPGGSPVYSTRMDTVLWIWSLRLQPYP